MQLDNFTEREALLADRNRKLEATLRAYDSLLNTRAADSMRRRLAVLERVLADVVNSGAVVGKEGARLSMILGKKFQSDY
jgi:hypothetical protein